MAQHIVGTSPEALPTQRSRLLIQNLGPGNLYLDRMSVAEEDLPHSGIQIVPGMYFDFGTAWRADMWMIADQADTDVRILEIY